MFHNIYFICNTQELLEEAYRQKILENKQMSEERTAKKRAKRLKRKNVLKARGKLLKKNNSTKNSDESDTTNDNDDDQNTISET